MKGTGSKSEPAYTAWHEHQFHSASGVSAFARLLALLPVHKQGQPATFLICSAHGGLLL